MTQQNEPTKCCPICSGDNCPWYRSSGSIKQHDSSRKIAAPPQASPALSASFFCTCNAVDAVPCPIHKTPTLSAERWRLAKSHPIMSAIWWDDRKAEAYARHVTAERDAEIERLKRELDEYKTAFRLNSEELRQRNNELQAAHDELKKHLHMNAPETVVGGIRNLAQVAASMEDAAERAEQAEARVVKLEAALRSIANDPIIGKEVLDAAATWYRSIADAALASTTPQPKAE